MSTGREIKFRGKRIDNGEWVYGNRVYMHSPKNGYSIGIQMISGDGFRPWASIKVDPETVGQYTGRNYDGDIIEGLDGKKYVVYWDETECAFKLDYKYYHHKDKDECHTYLPMYSRKGKVIGNIHDNPELLKEA